MPGTSWNLFVLYFGGWTLHKKAFSIQNKGHLGCRCRNIIHHSILRLQVRLQSNYSPLIRSLHMLPRINLSAACDLAAATMSSTLAFVKLKPQTPQWHSTKTFTCLPPVDCGCLEHPEMVKQLLWNPRIRWSQHGHEVLFARFLSIAYWHL